MLLKARPKRLRWPIFAWLGTCVTRWPLLVIAFWLVVPTVLFFATPSLSDEISDHPVELVPASAPAMVAEERMAEAFHESGGDNLVLVVLTDDSGLSRRRRERLPRPGERAAQRHPRREHDAGLRRHPGAARDGDERGRQGVDDCRSD